MGLESDVRPGNHGNSGLPSNLTGIAEVKRKPDTELTHNKQVSLLI